MLLLFLLRESRKPIKVNSGQGYHRNTGKSLHEMTPFTNIESYNVEMRKSLIDKVFFVDKIDAEVIVDFGCADGTLIEFLKTIFPEVEVIGFEIEKEMIEICKRKKLNVTNDWDRVLKFINGRKSALILSSVIHEVYSYSNPSEIDIFWSRVWNSGFDYVAIRDMMVSGSASRASDPLQVARIRQVFDTNKLREWEDIWGSLNENWSLVHFLLTYRYETNWSREIRENYLPINVEKFLNLIDNKYLPEFYEHYTLPFLRREVHKTFGFDLQERTHIKIVLSKNNK